MKTYSPYYSTDNTPGIIHNDPYLEPFKDYIVDRIKRIQETEFRLTQDKMTISNFSLAHDYYGIHRTDKGWVFREWAPNATSIHMVGDFNGWQVKPEYSCKRINDGGDWELFLSFDELKHQDLYKLHVEWEGGSGERIPAYARRVVQDEDTKVFSAQIWQPESSYEWKQPDFKRSKVAPRIYEAHIGMAQIEGKVGTFDEFRIHVLPRIIDAGYNTIQFMAIQEHPYYGSFGYHVSSFFAVSSRFGTPEELKHLIDEAHANGIAVIMDIVHSHSVKNENEGLSRFDGTDYQYFHGGARGEHSAWDSRCFNYGKTEVLHFLLSNCRFWLDEYKFDGFRFDGVTSMLYYDHGLGHAFSSYGDYFNEGLDKDAVTYMGLANTVIHQVNPNAISIAEDMSGIPGCGVPVSEGGIGFDYRLAMGIPDYWIKVVKHLKDEDWNVSELYYELTNRRRDEKVVGYSESHDQALVGDKTIVFRLIDKEMYTGMNIYENNLIVERGIALHNMIRALTLTTSGDAYLNFMGNEFGHPEWIDFPREGNGWSYHYARRQWNLRDDENLRYRFMADFDKQLMDITERFHILEHRDINQLFEHWKDQVLAFSRAGLIFIFNFNPETSFPDYKIDVPPGEYHLILNSDDKAYGGNHRLPENHVYFSREEKYDTHSRNVLSLYIPTRTVMVLQRSN